LRFGCSTGGKRFPAVLTLGCFYEEAPACAKRSGDGMPSRQDAQFLRGYPQITQIYADEI
jgi:hypothetical protein